MKPSYFIALLRNDLRLAWPLFLLAPFYAYMSIDLFGREHHLNDLNPVSSGGFLVFIMPFIAFNLLFQSESYGFKNPGRPVIGSLEFMFTRAIDRRALFGAKSSLYLVLCSLPMLLIWTYSYTTPSLKLQLPYSERDHRQEAKQFYLSHFEDARLQEPEAGSNKAYVIFPKGRIDQSICTFLQSIVLTLLFQALLFTFPRQRWLSTLLMILLVVALPFSSFAHKSPTPYEYFAAWVAQHTVLAFLGTGLLVAMAELYCCRRFIRTEIVS